MKIEVEDSALRAWLTRLAQEAKDLRPALDEIGAALRTSTFERFRASKEPSGESWRPLSPVTLALRRKGRGSGGARILWNSGRLANSISYRVGDRYVEVGTNTVYARTQHFGARKGAFGRYSQVGRVRKYGLGTFKGSAGTQKGFPIPWGDIPPRPFLGISSDDRREIIDILRARLAQTAQ
jgi:phage virion morphogenesis protein